MSKLGTLFVDQTGIASGAATNEFADVWVVIPARNEQAALPHVLCALPKVGRVIVVDNGSTDKTADVATDFGVDVISELRAGYGSACLGGLRHIDRYIEKGGRPPEVIVFLDADYSDYPDELSQLVRPILAKDFEFVLGSRLKGRRQPGSMPVQSAYGNKLACFLIWLFWGAVYSDLGPFRAISFTALQSLGMQDTNFGWTVEMQIKAAIAKLRIQEVPVQYRRRIGQSKISGTVMGTIRASYKILYVIARYRWLTWKV